MLRIYQAFLLQLHQLGQLCPLCSVISTQCKYDPPAVVASRLTIGLGLFYEHAARRHERQAAPSPQYYQRLAAGCFAVTGYETIASKLPQWLNFLRGTSNCPGCRFKTMRLLTTRTH